MNILCAHAQAHVVTNVDVHDKNKNIIQFGSIIKIIWNFVAFCAIVNIYVSIGRNYSTKPASGMVSGMQF